MAVGLVAFALATVLLERAAETTRPEWRDPEYGHRLKQVMRWQAKRPNRPLVLVVGSSRTQYGVVPNAMGFPNESDSPWVYNFGYRGAVPLGVLLQLTRALDAGLRPHAVVVQMSATEVRTHGPAEAQLARWAPRLSEADLAILAPYTDDATVFRRAIAAGRRDPWARGARRWSARTCPSGSTATCARRTGRGSSWTRPGSARCRPNTWTRRSWKKPAPRCRRTAR